MFSSSLLADCYKVRAWGWMVWKDYGVKVVGILRGYAFVGMIAVR